MINSRYIMIFGLFIFGLCDSSLIFSKHGDKSKEKARGEFHIKFEHFDFSRLFVEEMLRKHPLVLSAGVTGLMSYYLYPDYCEKLKKFILDNRHVVAAGALLALAVAYVKRDYLEKKYFPEAEDAVESSSENLGNFSKSGVRVYSPGEIKTKFKDVAGLETAKEDLQDILMFLKDPAKFEAMGAKIPKGVLLSGSPGNGKTLLARALAGEAKCPFLYITASEFIEAIVGIGAARMRHLFGIARDLAPCIIFIDEIDAIGRKRSAHSSGGDTELTQTLNQLLAEMDGFEQHDNPIIIIAATNRVDVLDSALTRPGRFDRKIEIAHPFIKDRCKILEIKLKAVKSAPDIDVLKIAQGTKGFSGAELAELINEAAILAIRENALFVTMHHIDLARDYMLLGRETKGMDIPEEELWVTAIHEAGHAIVRACLKHAKPLYKVTIVPRGGALGLTHGMNTEKYSQTDTEMLAEIQVILGGSVAEEMIFGHRAVGAVSDLEKARYVATSMVMAYGMTEEFKDVSFGEFINNQVHLPDTIATKLHNAVAKVISECRQKTWALLEDHKAIMLALAEKLMDEGTVFGSEVYKLCGIQEPSIVYSLSA